MSRASLPMYDLVELRDATDAWWAGIARGLTGAGITGVPTALARGTNGQAAWRAPDLLLSQICGYPLMHEYAGRLRVVATPCYDCTGCDGPHYSSHIVVRADDPARALSDVRGRVAAVNSSDSQSGYNALRAEIAPLAAGGRFFAHVVQTGSHANSLALVAQRKADVCAVDCVTHGLLAQCRPSALAELRILAGTVSAPGLPYVTRADVGADLLEILRAALFAALSDPDLAAVRRRLLIADLAVLPDEAYGRVVDIEKSSLAHDYAVLA